MGATAELDRVSDLCARMHFSLRGADIAGGLLEPVAGFLGAETASFRSMVLEDDAAKPLFVVGIGIPETVHASYLTHFYQLDPARRLLFRRLTEPLFANPARSGEWSKEYSAPGMFEQHQSEFRRYRREFLVPNGFYHHVGFCIPDSDGRVLLFDFHRTARSRAFGTLERARARVVALFLHAKAGPNWHVDGAHGSADLETRLSAREIEVAEAVAIGLSNKQVASRLGISVRTVENHLRSIFAKLGVTTRTKLAAKLRETDSRRSLGVPAQRVVVGGSS
ncbi:MAG TPA: helix-turn-helix transcriptional regulator [Gammaproteobacteria bacterium]|nr:helix-turn-helix transcriptional regulator [Gammaproteobacteria bacterium]